MFYSIYGLIEVPNRGWYGTQGWFAFLLAPPFPLFRVIFENLVLMRSLLVEIATGGDTRRAEQANDTNWRKPGSITLTNNNGCLIGGAHGALSIPRGLRDYLPIAGRRP